MELRVSALAVVCFMGMLSANVFAADVTITAIGNAWDTPNVVIDNGDTVTWTNLGATHNVAESANALANVYNGTGFRSGAVGAMNTYQNTFPAPGTYFFLCEPHATVGMKGTVTVNFVPSGPPAMPTQSKTLLYGLIGILAVIGVAFMVMGKRLLVRK
jgi:plastocyanin